MKRTVWFALFAGMVCLSPLGMAADAQSLATAARVGDLQVGVQYTSASSDYTTDRIKGLGFYSTFDFFKRFGVEVDFHQLNDPQSDVYQRTYEVGGRYVFRQRGRIRPYAKALFGRGVLNFPNDAANIAYNMLVGGVGVDFHVLQRLNVRVDVEYQKWNSGLDLPNGLSPILISGGVAYHFPPGKLHIEDK